MLDYYYKNIFEVAAIDNASLISGLGEQRLCSPAKAAITTSFHTMNHRAHLKTFKALAFHLCAGTHRRAEAEPATSTAHRPRAG